MATGIAIAGLIVSAIGTYKSIEAQGEAASARRRAATASEKQRQLQAQEQRRQKAREERVRRAQLLQASALTGTIGSSGEAGALGSINTQFQAGSAFANNLVSLGTVGSQALQSAQQSDIQASIFGTTAGLGFSAFKNASEINSAINNL